MDIFLILLFFINLCIAILVYKKFHRSRKLFSDRFGMILSSVASGTIGVVLGMIAYLIFPVNLTINSLISVIIAGTIGVMFGALVKFHSLLAGFFNGVISGLMGTMLGAIIKNPSLCSLPPSYLNSVEENMIYFSLFGTAIVLVTFWLLLFSLRV